MKNLKFLLAAILFATAILFAPTTQAQQFFKRIPKPIAGHSVIAGVQAEPTIQNVFRPVLNIASYAIGDNSLLNGGGVSYQHLKYENEKWSSVWSVNGVAWYKSSFTGDGSAFAAGLTVGFFNNLIMIGGGKTFANVPGSNGLFGTFGVGVNLNN